MYLLIYVNFSNIPAYQIPYHKFHQMLPYICNASLSCIERTLQCCFSSRSYALPTRQHPRHSLSSQYHSTLSNTFAMFLNIYRIINRISRSLS